VGENGKVACRKRHLDDVRVVRRAVYSRRDVFCNEGNEDRAYQRAFGALVEGRFLKRSGV